MGELAHSIQKLADDLNYMKKERGEFLASVAHELRTPLTYIRGYADIILKTKMSTQDQKHYLSIIKEEADHVTGLVQDLFELAKMEKHNFIINTKQTNLYDLLKHIVAKIQPAYTEKIFISFSHVQKILFFYLMNSALNKLYSIC